MSNNRRLDELPLAPSLASTDLVFVEKDPSGAKAGYAATVAMIGQGALPSVTVDADNTGVADIHDAVLAAQAMLPLEGGVLILRTGLFRLAQALVLRDGVTLRGQGCSGNAAMVGATVIMKDGNFDGITCGASGGVEMLDLDGAPGNGGDGIYCLSIRQHYEYVAVKRQGGDAWRLGGKTNGHNANVCRFTDIRAYNNVGRAMFVHDVDPAGPNANSCLILGLDYQGNGGGLIVQNSIDGQAYGLFGALNDSWSLWLKTGAKGWNVVSPYLEEGTAGDVFLDAGSQDNWVGPPRQGVPTGSDWVDSGTDNVMIYRPNKLGRFLTNKMAFSNVEISDPAISGLWNITQDAADRGLEMTLNATGNTPIRWDVAHGSGGKIRAQISGDLTVTDFIHFGDFTTGPGLFFGAGNPEGVITAKIGSLYLRTDGPGNGQTYVKVAGSGNTNWNPV